MHANILTYTQVISEGKVWVQLDASIRELPIFCPVDCLEPYHGQPLAATREGRKSGGETTEKNGGRRRRAAAACAKHDEV